MRLMQEIGSPELRLETTVLRNGLEWSNEWESIEWARC